MMRRGLLVMLVVAMVAASCGGSDEGGTVRVATHDFFAIPEELIAQFSAETGYEVEIIRGGDAGLVVNQAVLTAGNPIADVLFGVDTTLLSRARAADLFLPYRSPLLDEVPRSLHVPAHFATPIDLGDVCLNIDLESGLAPPISLTDLALPEYAGTLAVPDPTVSTPGLAFLLATVATFGETGAYTWLDFWEDLRSNDVLISADWGTAYYGAFSGTGGGDRPLVVSYASSPPAEVLFADPPVDAASTAVVEAGCFRQVEYAGVLRGADEPRGARAFIDFLLELDTQEAVPTSMFVFPVRSDAELPEVFAANTIVPEAPLSLDPDEIETNRDRWLSEWTAVVLR
jgi:thiamine transport system substrate-binding protein